MHVGVGDRILETNATPFMDEPDRKKRATIFKNREEEVVVLMKRKTSKDITPMQHVPEDEEFIMTSEEEKGDEVNADEVHEGGYYKIVIPPEGKIGWKSGVTKVLKTTFAHSA
jgi:hypothetical protein